MEDSVLMMCLDPTRGPCDVREGRAKPRLGGAALLPTKVRGAVKFVRAHQPHVGLADRCVSRVQGGRARS